MLRLTLAAALAAGIAVPAHAQSFWSRITSYVASNAYAQSNVSRAGSARYFSLNSYVPGTAATIGSISINAYGFPNKPVSRMNAYERSVYNTLTARRANLVSSTNRSLAARDAIISQGWDPYDCRGCEGNSDQPY